MAIQRLSSPSPGKTDIIESFTIGDGEVSDWYILPSGNYTAGFQLNPNGTAYVDTTIDTVENIKANLASAIKWPAGDVIIPTQGELRAATAVRFVSVSGAATLNVRVIIG